MKMFLIILSIVMHGVDSEAMAEPLSGEQKIDSSPGVGTTGYK